MVLSSHDIARIQVATHLTEPTIRKVMRGGGRPSSRVLVAAACEQLGLPQPTAPNVEERREG